MRVRNILCIESSLVNRIIAFMLLLIAASVLPLTTNVPVANGQITGNLGSCTDGQVQCQAGRPSLCVCHENAPGVIYCSWEDTSVVDCSGTVVMPPPPCNRSYKGATHKFTDGSVKTCSCRIEDDSDCWWI